MTKKEIVKTISEEIGLTQLKTKEIVQKAFDAIIETLGGRGANRAEKFWGIRGQVAGGSQGTESPNWRERSAYLRSSS